MLGFGTHRIVILCVSHLSFDRLLRYLPIFLDFEDLRSKLGTVELFGLSSILLTDSVNSLRKAFRIKNLLPRLVNIRLNTGFR